MEVVKTYIVIDSIYGICTLFETKDGRYFIQRNLKYINKYSLEEVTKNEAEFMINEHNI